MLAAAVLMEQLVARAVQAHARLGQDWEIDLFPRCAFHRDGAIACLAAVGGSGACGAGDAGNFFLRRVRSYIERHHPDGVITMAHMQEHTRQTSQTCS
jgi:hypothetical protein